MKKALLKFLLIYLLFAAMFVVMKPVFLLVYRGVILPAGADWWRVMWHGLAMDLSVAGYLTVIPGLLLMAALLTRRRWPRQALSVYMGVISLTIAVLYSLDMGLYGEWGFRLDMTPFFYITTSPAAAMASVQWWQWLAGIAGIAAITAALWAGYRAINRRIAVDTAEGSAGRRLLAAAGMLVATGLLFIPIRGSLTVSTMNPSRAYFSTRQGLNHAAMNPLFSLLYSATHQGDFGSCYRYMTSAEADSVLARVLLQPDSTRMESRQRGLPSLPALPAVAERPDLRVERPDVVMVVLESFSSHLLPTLGGADVAPGLDSIARSGVLFTNIYASSFRTDRALAAIFSGFPAPPGTSLLKYPERFERLPSLPGELRAAGYQAAYYYGGDANFTNMQAYLRSMGFDPLISDKDFPIEQKTSKWGAHDHLVYARALRDISAPGDGRPRLSVVQTSSSHAPFEVPYSNPRFADDPRANSLAYADSCLTDFVGALRRLPGWERMLVVLVPDHWGTWPATLESAVERHRIPVVLTGGALIDVPRRVDALASQTDLAATLLGMLGLPTRAMRYSRDIFSPTTAQIAIFTESSLIGIVTPTDTLIYNPDGGGGGGEAPQPVRHPGEGGALQPVRHPSEGEAPRPGRHPGGGGGALLEVAKAMLRDIYATLEDPARGSIPLGEAQQ